MSSQDATGARRAYGSGSVFERNGAWFGKWRVDGVQVKRRLGPKRKRGERDGVTKSQAEARMRELMAEVKPSDVTPRDGANGLTIAVLSARYVDYGRDHKKLKAGTLKEYESVTRTHLIPFFGNTPLQRVDPARVEAFAEHLRTKRGSGHRGRERLSPKTIENVLGSLTVLFNFAVRKKLLALSPMTAADLPRFGDSDAPIERLRFLEPPEVERLITAVAPGEYAELDRALYAVAALTGMRQGELRGLRWSSVDFERVSIHVSESLSHGRRSSPKGKRARTVPMAPTAVAWLLALRAVSPWTAPNDPVFACASTGKPMAVTPMMERFGVALSVAGVNRVTFHELRHTFGTALARAGADVGTIQGLMGHCDLSVTALYMHFAPATKHAALIEDAFGLSTNPGTKLSQTEPTKTQPAYEEAA